MQYLIWVCLLYRCRDLLTTLLDLQPQHIARQWIRVEVCWTNELHFANISSRYNVFFVSWHFLRCRSFHLGVTVAVCVPGQVLDWSVCIQTHLFQGFLSLYVVVSKFEATDVLGTQAQQDKLYKYNGLKTARHVNKFTSFRKQQIKYSSSMIFRKNLSMVFCPNY